MIRHARMLGRPTLFLPGLDHASIAAQFVLDGILAEGGREPREPRPRALPRADAGVRRRDPRGRSSPSSGGSARSCDWGRLRFTMDDGSAKAVRVAFERLYRDGLAYRTEALINWCPGCRTSVSDLEVIPTPETGTLWTVRYHLIDPATGQPDPDATITVATTRPETILGDTAVAVHPDDARYAPLVGRTVRIPFVERDVPIIADAVVDPAFGTGAVKITPAHDHDDYADRAPPRPARCRRSSTTPRGREHRDAATTGSTATRPARGSWRTSRRAAISPASGPRDGHRSLPADRRRRRAAPEDPVVRPDGAARRGGPRGDPQRPDPDPPRRASRRPGSTG